MRSLPKPCTGDGTHGLVPGTSQMRNSPVRVPDKCSITERLSAYWTIAARRKDGGVMWCVCVYVCVYVCVCVCVCSCSECICHIVDVHRVLCGFI